jgi:hypothetical protein
VAGPTPGRSSNRSYFFSAGWSPFSCSSTTIMICLCGNEAHCR